MGRERLSFQLLLMKHRFYQRLSRLLGEVRRGAQWIFWSATIKRGKMLSTSRSKRTPSTFSQLARYQQSVSAQDIRREKLPDSRTCAEAVPMILFAVSAR